MKWVGSFLKYFFGLFRIERKCKNLQKVTEPVCEKWLSQSLILNLKSEIKWTQFHPNDNSRGEDPIDFLWQKTVRNLDKKNGGNFEGDFLTGRTDGSHMKLQQVSTRTKGSQRLHQVSQASTAMVLPQSHHQGERTGRKRMNTALCEYFLFVYWKRM